MKQQAQQIATRVKAGGMKLNHRQTLVAPSGIKVGGPILQHNETLRR